MRNLLPGEPRPAGVADPSSGPATEDHREMASQGTPWSLPAPGRRGRRARWRRILRWAGFGAVLSVLGLIFRRAVAWAVLAALSAALHLVGLNLHLPSVRLAWPWQAAGTGTASTTELGPWVLQRIEGISRPALGQANFTFSFTRKVSKNIGPWPCWYASTFYAVARASATVDLNPGTAWWSPASGHYRLRILAQPRGGRPGRVTVAMVLPRPELPQSPHAVSIDDLPSRPVATQHSWTYPGFGCGVLLRPQFPQSVMYAQAQEIAFYKARHSPQITSALVAAAEAEAVRTIRDNFVQPTVNAFGYLLASFTVRWATGQPGGPGRPGRPGQPGGPGKRGRL
jgi:hypothetical protein